MSISPDDNVSCCLLTIKQAATMLSVSYNTVRGLIWCGKLRSFQIGPRGGCFRINAADLVAYLKGCSVETEAVQRKPNKRRSPVANRFEKLNGQRLLQAWADAGVVTDAAPSNEP